MLSADGDKPADNTVDSGREGSVAKPTTHETEERPNLFIFCIANIFIPLRLHYRKKCPGMLLSKEGRSWRHHSMAVGMPPSLIPNGVGIHSNGHVNGVVGPWFNHS
ncbi:hypothetical protein M0R45_008475 [Rubus argutus]|uniref:Uncharacterized protein n=1 Tax=Rubus argutus TaxID=59490 RepID=A0AAW1Y519_RUBAR